jgi:tRNA uridine 5-carboxymethylaminomethyl modification enzyme
MTSKDFDIIVVGGGHAGIEAASAPARMGLSVALVTMQRTTIGLMSCNPAIGGLAKGQLVKEIDALGGEMAKITDATGIHFKMLNTSKGPAVWSPRAQADRMAYAGEALWRLQNISNLEIFEGMATRVIIDRESLAGIELQNGETLSAKAVVLTTGTFLNGLIHMGMWQLAAGRAGEAPATGITESLLEAGFEAGRLKTGTPPRLHRDTIDFNCFAPQFPDNPPTPFSYATEKIERKQINCYIGHTNSRTHEILREGFAQSPLFTGRIRGIGPRYCPSIETKIDRFADRERHQLFLEPEGYDDPEVYLNGFSTSLPENIQVRAVQSITGLEKAEIIRLGYAVEYDFFPPHQLHYTLETKRVKGLYFAGQINGTSGYEEAAAQGLVAGINAALKIYKQESLRFDRSQAYIGVLIDDLINKSTLEPYRMFTSRAEFRLLLRQDNADLRLSDIGRTLGLLDPRSWERLQKKRRDIKKLNAYLKSAQVSPEVFNKAYARHCAPILRTEKLTQLVKRPEVDLEVLLELVNFAPISAEACQEVSYNIKYEGYIRRNRELIARFQEMENRPIPVDFEYPVLEGLSSEAKEKLMLLRPSSFGQASRISGVSPADLSVLLIYLERAKYGKKVSRETSVNS